MTNQKTRTVDANTFQELMSDPARFVPLKPKEAEPPTDLKCAVSENGAYGFAIAPDGKIWGAFATESATSSLKEMLDSAHAAGATHAATSCDKRTLAMLANAGTAVPVASAKGDSPRETHVSFALGADETAKLAAQVYADPLYARNPVRALKRAGVVKECDTPEEANNFAKSIGEVYAQPEVKQTDLVAKLDDQLESLNAVIDSSAERDLTESAFNLA